MTYEYSCKACGHGFESEQRITDKPLHVCPKCGAGALQRLVSGGTGVIFQGGGWARDCYSRATARAGENRGQETDK